MAENDIRDAAELRFEQALKATGGRDPRDFYRDRLRDLKKTDAEAFQRALAYYDTRLIPAVARQGSDPLGEWLEYGRFLAGLVEPGKTVQVDASGRAVAYAPPVPLDALVLHLPDHPGRPALLVGLPTQLSPAQRATYDLLVKGATEG